MFTLYLFLFGIFCFLMGMFLSRFIKNISQHPSYKDWVDPLQYSSEYVEAMNRHYPRS